jgi:hypothetical protein
MDKQMFMRMFDNVLLDRQVVSTSLLAQSEKARYQA